MNNMEIRRGDIYNVQNGGRFSGGTTISGFRPAVIVSNNTGNHFSNCVEVVYLTTQDKKPLPTHAPVMGKVPSTALCEQINTVGKDKLGEYIRTCSAEEMQQIDAALMVSLGLTPPRMVEKHIGGGGDNDRATKGGSGKNAPQAGERAEDRAGGLRKAQGRARHV